MINITDIKASVLTDNGLFADVYDITGDTPHLLGKTYIKPYREEIKKDVNGITLFVDADYNIFSGQISKYNWHQGLHLVEFIEN